MEISICSKVPKRILVLIICGVIGIVFMCLSFKIHRIFLIGFFLFAVYTVICVISAIIASLGKEIKIVSVTLKVIVIIYTLFSIFGVYATLNHDFRMRRAIAISGLESIRNIKRLICDYSQNNNYMPDADHWCDLIIRSGEQVSDRVFTIPQYTNINCSFAFNKNDQRQLFLPSDDN